MRDKNEGKWEGRDEQEQGKIGHEGLGGWEQNE